MLGLGTGVGVGVDVDVGKGGTEVRVRVGVEIGVGAEAAHAARNNTDKTISVYLYDIRAIVALQTKTLADLMRGFHRATVDLTDNTPAPNTPRSSDSPADNRSPDRRDR